MLLYYYNTCDSNDVRMEIKFDPCLFCTLPKSTVFRDSIVDISVLRHRKHTELTQYRFNALIIGNLP